jgi:hypothetical protein
MNKRNAIWIITGALALGLSACLWESEQDDGGTLGGMSGGSSTGFTGGSGPGVTGGGSGFTGGSGTGVTGGGSGFTGGSGTSVTGGVFFLRSTDGGAAADEPEASSDGTSSAGD